MDKDYNVKTLISKYLYFRVSNLPNIKIASMFIKITFKDTKKLKELDTIH